mgnify:CR=1 FL=1
MRLLLESYAVSHIDEEQREKYRERMEYLLQVIQTAPRPAYAELDAELHETIILMSGNDTLLNLYRLLYSQITTFRQVSLSAEATFADATKAHVAILDGLLNGNDERVLKIISNHLRISQDAVKEYYNQI